jgi:divalent metal cation (Fe/Co/Zn/Cd) transporter
LLIALSGTILQQRGLLYADGIASIGIGAVLCCVAFIVIRESRGLLIGESAARSVSDGIRAILADEDDAIERIDRVVTLHLGPDNVLLILSLTFAARPQTDIDAAVERIRTRIATEIPIVKTSTLSLSSIPARPAGRSALSSQ